MHLKTFFYVLIFSLLRIVDSVLSREFRLLFSKLRLWDFFPKCGILALAGGILSNFFETRGNLAFITPHRGKTDDTPLPLPKNNILKLILWLPSFCAFECKPGLHYIFKVVYKNTRARCEYVQSNQKRHQNNANGVVLMSLLLTLKMFYILF